MNARLIQSVLRHATSVAHGAAAEDDAALLRTVALGRDPAAFAELVRRYGRLVWAVCRQLRPTDADAEDAFQATFLVLLRSADRIRTHALGPWLHTVAHRVACKAARGDGHRHRRERAAATPDRDAAVPPSAWDAMLGAVHEEVAKLPDHLRVPFVLSCLEGRAANDAAKQLGWKIGTFSGRLTRAKQVLLDRLTKRGLAAPAIAVAGFAGAVPGAATAKALDLIRANDAIPLPILELAKGATTMTKTKLLAAALLVAAGLTASVGGWLASSQAQDRAVANEVKALADAVARAADPKPVAKWEYHYQPQLYDKDGKVAGIKPADFESTMDAMEKDGWTFLGQMHMRLASTLSGNPEGKNPGVSLPTLVFRRLKAQAVKEEPKGVALQYRYEPSTDPNRAIPLGIDVPLGEPVLRREPQTVLELGSDRLNGRADPAAGRANKPLADETAAVRKRLAEARAKMLTIRFDAREFGVTAEELQTVLKEAIDRKAQSTGEKNPIQLKLIGSDSVEASGGSVASFRWLKDLMESAKSNPPVSR